MESIDLAAVLGIERESFSLGGVEYEIRHPGELSFVEKAAAVRLFRQISEAQKSLGLQFVPEQRQDGTQGPLPDMPVDDSEAARIAADVERMTDELIRKIVVSGPVERLSDAAREVLVMRFFSAMPKLAQSVLDVGLRRSKTSADSPADSPQPAAETP